MDTAAYVTLPTSAPYTPPENATEALPFGFAPAPNSNRIRHLSNAADITNADHFREQGNEGQQEIHHDRYWHSSLT